MKSLLLAILSGMFLLGAVLEAESQTSDDRVKMAIAAYDAGNYDEAFQEWKLISQTTSDPDVFYNMGNSAFHAGNTAEAIFAYEQYLRFRPGSKEVEELISNARAQIENAVVPLPKFFLLKWLQNGLSLFRPGAWAFLSLVVFIIAVSIWLARINQISYLSFLENRNILVFLIVGGVLLFIAFLSYRQIYRKNEAIVFSECEMYQGPSAQSPLVRTIYPGEKVIIKDTLTGWKKINLINLDEGWISHECARIIEFGREAN